MEKVLVFGGSGFIGEYFLRNIVGDYQAVGTYWNHLITIPGVVFRQVNIIKKESVLELVKRENPDHIVHLAALASADLRDPSMIKEYNLVNVEGTKNIVDACKETNSNLVYMSSDYVFDGEKGLYSEDDEPNPINEYGKSKYLGEIYAKKNLSKPTIVRLTMTYGWNRPRQNENLVGTIINASQTGKSLILEDDQYRNPIYVEDVAEALRRILDMSVTGIINLGGPDYLSKYDFGMDVCKTFNLSQATIEREGRRGEEEKIKKPLKTGVNISKTRRKLKMEFHTVSSGLDLMKASAL